MTSRRLVRRSFVALWLLAFSVALLGCSQASVEDFAVQASPEVIKSQERFKATYLITSGDIIEVVVDREAGLGRTVTVGPDGFVSLPGAGSVKVAGLSTTRAAHKIEKALSDRLLDPDVAVIVTNPPVPSMFVAGEVGGARSVPLRDVTNAAEAIILAGGLQRTAALDRVALLRLDSDGFLRATLIEGPTNEQASLFLALSAVSLKPGDILIAPESSRSQFVRSLQDFVTTPLVAVNAIISPLVQLELLTDLQDS